MPCVCSQVSGLEYQTCASDPGYWSRKTDEPKDHVICVYADPFWESGEVERVLRGLRAAGIGGPLLFKADGARAGGRAGARIRAARPCTHAHAS
jgi:hypothetical protein